MNKRLVEVLTFLIVNFTILVTLSCGTNEGNKETSPDTDNTIKDDLANTLKSDNARTFFLVNVVQMNLREYPNINSRIVHKLEENEMIQSEDEPLDFIEKVGKYEGQWVEVSTIDERHRGYVFNNEYFLTVFVDSLTVDSLYNSGKGMVTFTNLDQKRMEEFVGVDWNDQVNGSRYSGYYTYDKNGDKSIPDGAINFRVRRLNKETKASEFVDCHAEISSGTPVSSFICD